MKTVRVILSPEAEEVYNHIKLMLVLDKAGIKPTNEPGRI